MSNRALSKVMFVRHRTVAIGLLICVLVFPPSIFADDIHWISNDSQSWGNSANWSLGVVPGPGDASLYDVTIDHNGPDDVVFDIGTTIVKSLSLGGNGTSALELSNGSDLTLETPTLATGNVLAVNNGGVLNVSGGSSAILELSAANTGAAITGLGQINVTDQGALVLQDFAGGNRNIQNDGAMSFSGDVQLATLNLSDNGAGSTFTLTGGGSLQLGGSGRIFGLYGEENLVNDVNHRITGNGLIGNVNLTNNGLIEAADGNLILSPGASGVITNGASGNMNVGYDSSLTIQNLNGGTTSIVNDGAINIFGGSGSVEVDNTSLVLDDGNQVGTFAFSSPGNTGAIYLNGGNSAILGANGDETLVNGVGHTIQGSGLISNLYLTNNGTINALGGNLTIDLTSTGLLQNTFDQLNPDRVPNINIIDGASLTIRDTSGLGSTIQNDGNINLTGGVIDPSLIFDSGGKDPNTFTLSGFGYVTMNGDKNSISGASGLETLVNDVDHTIQGNGTISNFAAFTNNGYLESQTLGTLTVDTTANLTNWNAKTATLTGGAWIADANSTLQISALGSDQIQILNGASVTLFGGGGEVPDGQLIGDGSVNAAAGIYKVYSGTSGEADLTLVGMSGTVALAKDSNGIFTVASNDANQFGNGFAGLGLFSTTATLDGDLVNRANTYHHAGDASSWVLLENGASLTVDSLTNSATTYRGSGQEGGADAEVNLLGSTLTVNGTFDNLSIDSSPHQDGFAIASFNMVNSTATITGLFTNGANSFVTMDAIPPDFFPPTPGQCGCLQEVTATLPVGDGPPPGSVLNTNGGLSNAGTINLFGASTLNNTGNFTNTGVITLDNNSTLTSAPDSGQDGPSAPGTGPDGPKNPSDSFQNSGLITTGSLAGGGNKINVTGDIFNTSPGVVNLEGYGDKMTATGQFVNSGGVTLSGGNERVWAATGIDNQAATSDVKGSGTITLDGAGNKVATAGAITNEGTIAFTGGDGKVWSGTSIDNTGTIDMSGLGGDVVATKGAFTNEGSVHIGDGEIVSADVSYTQTSGTTTIDSGGTLTAANVDLQGGLINAGGATINGKVNVSGGTLDLGDPQSLEVYGDYDQTAGTLDIFLAEAGVGNYDQVDVHGNVTLEGGNLDLIFEDSFFSALDITDGTVFDIINSVDGTVTGDLLAFNNITFGENNSLTFQEVFNANGHELDLDVVQVDTSATPEPSTISMLFGAMMLGGAVAWRRNRSRTRKTS